MNKILVVEDDNALKESLYRYLLDEALSPVIASNLQEARDFVKKESADVIILDWMLPDGQGIDFLREFRLTNKQTPVLMLTARSELVDKVVGLETGANDYLTKPFAPKELMARVRVLLRDFNGKGPILNDVKSELVIGKLKMNFLTRDVFYNSELVELTKMEFDFLKLLAEAPGRAFSREEILNKVWGYDSYPTTRTVDTHVLQLRQKLEDKLIDTVRGIGYRLVDL